MPPTTSPTTGPTAALLARLRAGDPAAVADLVSHTRDRLLRLARRMLGGFPRVARWEEAEDVLQGALLRLARALGAAAPASARHYYNLAALQVRRELLDLADRHAGPLGGGANHHSDPAGAAVAAAADPGGEPGSAAEWAEFHRQVGQLPADERDVFDLLWYGGHTQEEAAAALGVSVRTVKRRWQAARLALARAAGAGP